MIAPLAPTSDAAATHEPTAELALAAQHSLASVRCIVDAETTSQSAKPAQTPSVAEDVGEASCVTAESGRDVNGVTAASLDALATFAPACLEELKFQRHLLERLLRDQAGIKREVLAVDRDVALLAEIEPETGLDYQDSWPVVEVSVEVNEVVRFDLIDLTFDADFKIRLDWLDSKLRLGTHYQWNSEFGKFELAKNIRSCTNDVRFFNPSVIVENSKTLPEADSPVPIVADEVTRDGMDVAWLTRSFRFEGTLSCRNVNARLFPFDIENLQIKLTCPDMSGVTSLGHSRRIMLREPSLRKRFRLKQMQKMGPPRGWVNPSQTDEVMSHAWRVHEDDNNALQVGDMTVIGVGGVRMREGYEYVLHIVLRRVWYPRYFFDFLIQNLQVVSAIASLYVPFSDAMLADRMSITLTILLTVVASTSSRPPAIDGLSYPTTYDTYMQIMIFSVALITLGNLFVSMNCWGMYRDEGKDDYYDAELRMVVSETKLGMLRLDLSWCEEGSCGSSSLDCALFYFTIISLLCMFLIVTVRAQMHQISAVLMIKHEIDAIDKDPGKYSKLVLCYSDTKFRFAQRFEVLDYVYHVALLPRISWFWSCWCFSRWIRDHLSCNNPHEDDVKDEGEAFHAVRAKQLLQEAVNKKGDYANSLPGISRFYVKLSPFDIFCVLDVGSGEIGFYSYWLDQESRCVCAGGTQSKFKYNKNCTFSDQFLEDTDAGAIALADQVVVRFQMQSVSRETDSEASSVLSGKDDTSPSIASPELLGLLPEPFCGQPLSAGSIRITGTNLPGMVNRKRVNEDADLSSTIQQPPSMIIPTKCEPACEPKKASSDKSIMSVGLSRPHGKKKLLLGLTGENRQMLRDRERGKDLLDDLLRKVNIRLAPYGFECVPYSPEAKDEAMYELWATEWCVQNGDLDVSSMKLDKTYRTLQGGREDARTCLEEVRQEFCDLSADREIHRCYCNDRMEAPVSMLCSEFYSKFEESQPLLRSLLRSRLFTGTLSAGSGSVQMTLRSSVGLESSQVHSLPIGNRTPLVGLSHAASRNFNVFSPGTPKTCETAKALFVCSKTKIDAAWAEDGPVDDLQLSLWSELVLRIAEERQMPSGQRGLFVGISACYYAAKLAGCDEKILERDLFLDHIHRKRDELLEDGGKDGRGLSNLALVSSLTQYCLHRSAMIVCKRSWIVGDHNVIATWTLGLYLKHSGVMGVPIEVDSE
eukprot:TRINITY_DN18782_c0_g1_i1.p1 TRINITY_DN18782_c0_g1~~TRINITY_DN18782_c0_g1_i1.p1  ORF type:complete len:1208 (+),score=179.78 TRINITY_DN18782_c0_g1_i1:187-3810(+)